MASSNMQMAEKVLYEAETPVRAMGVICLVVLTILLCYIFGFDLIVDGVISGTAISAALLLAPLGCTFLYMILKGGKWHLKVNEVGVHWSGPLLGTRTILDEDLESYEIVTSKGTDHSSPFICVLLKSAETVKLPTSIGDQHAIHKILLAKWRYGGTKIPLGWPGCYWPSPNSPPVMYADTEAARTSRASKLISALDINLRNFGIDVSCGLELPDGPVVALFGSRFYFSFKRLKLLSQHIAVCDYSNTTAFPEDVQTLFHATYREASQVQTEMCITRFTYVVIPCLVVSTVSEALVEYIERRPRKHMSVLEFPVVVNWSTGQIYYCKKRGIWDAFVYSDIRIMVRCCIEESIAQVLAAK